MTSCVTWSDRWPTAAEARAAFVPGRPLELLVRLDGCVWAFGVTLCDGAVYVLGGGAWGVRGPLDALAATLRGGAWSARFAGAPCAEPYGAPVGAEVDDERR